jgi:PAS domain S-box-containing protein
MSLEENDITLSLISESDVRSKIWKIFPDSVILNQEFKIVSVSKNICETLGYHSDELRGVPISQIANTHKLQEMLEEKLRPGFFEGYQVEIQTKQDRQILYSISGFYLGLIANISDLIILKFRNLDEIRFLYQQIEAKTQELDQFIYQTAHRLRGPLATLKGLIHLATKNTDAAELAFLTAQMNVFADRLDNILHKLIYFAEADKAQELSPNQVTLAAIGTRLRRFVEEKSFMYPVQYYEHLPEPMTRVDNGELIVTLLQNIESFFSQQSTLAKQIHFKAMASHAFLEMSLLIKGITMTEKLKNKAEALNFGYVEILNEPEFTSLYAAKKIVLKLKGCICFAFFTPDEVCVHIAIPQSHF